MAGEGEVDCLSIQEAERGGQQIRVLLRVCPRDLKTSLHQGAISIRVSHLPLSLGGAHSTRTISTA